MNGNLTWLVRDSQGVLHRKSVPAPQVLGALRALAGGSLADQETRLLDHPGLRTHAPGLQGLIVVDLIEQRLINASHGDALTSVPFRPDSDPDLLNHLDAFDAAHKVRAVRFNARRRRPEALAPGFDPFVRTSGRALALGAPVPGVSRWDDLAIALEGSLPGATLTTDPAFGLGLTTASVSVPVPANGLSALAPLLTVVRSDAPTAVDPDATRSITGLDPDVWDLFGPVIELDLSPWTVEDLTPRLDDDADTWFDRVWRRLHAMGIAFTRGDTLAWDRKLRRNVDA